MALIEIQGVEVTQAIQYYNSAAHLTDTADQQPDNSATLVAGKPAWVRVYVRTGWVIGGLTRVTGRVTVKRRIFGWLWTTLGTILAQPPGSVTAYREVDYATERGNLGYTLNFIIPASMMCGRLRLDIRVERSFFIFKVSSYRSVTVDATLLQTLRLAGIMIGYDGPESTEPNAPNLTLAAPTLSDLQATSAWTLLTFPVRSAATYRIAGTLTWDLPLSDAPTCDGCCTPNWIALNSAVQAVRVADGNRTDVLYYGLLANGIPMGPIVGCSSGGSGVSTGSNGAGVTMAHELGHACGRPHSPCGTSGDPGYPAYEPYDPAGTPTASIGEYGLDISTGAIKPPDMFKDFMSYCGPRWVSLYVTGRLTNNAALDPGRACVDWPWLSDLVLYDRTLVPKKWLPDPPPDPAWLQRDVRPEPVISLTGVQHAPDDVEIKSVLRLEAQTDVPSGRRLDLRSELLDEAGHVIASAAVYGLRSFADCECGHDEGSGGDSYPRLIQTFIRDTAPGAALRIRRQDTELWSRRAPAAEATLGEVAIDLVEEEIQLSWSFESKADYEPEAAVQWSADGGRSWHALGAGIRGRSATLDARGLPAGELLIRLLASDGFFTATSQPMAITAPERPTPVSILSPRSGQTLTSPGSLRLWGIATSASGEAVQDEDARWLIDEREVATGLDTYVGTPPRGDHRATLMIKGPEGSVASSVDFTVVELPVERDENGEPPTDQRESLGRA
jgi:hypothetical protein